MTNGMRLGKKSARVDARTLQLAKYLPDKPAAPPSASDWLTKVSGWQMYGNDTLGDCVEAASGHLEDLWASYTKPTETQITDAQVIAAYSGSSGYVPGNPSTDNGTDMLTFLNYWKATGVDGRKIAGYVALKAGNLTELRQAIWLFGSAFIGLNMPVTAQGAPCWRVSKLTGNGAPGSWGGHCVPVGAYNEAVASTTRNTVVTWGETLTMSDYFYQCYNDEGYAVLSQDWITASSKLAPSGFNLTQLQADLAAL